MPLDEISKADCVRAHSRVACVGECGANDVTKSFRSIYNHARRTYDLPVCSTIAIEWFAEQPSRRIIEDINEWKRVVDGLENPVHTAYYRLLLTTAYAWTRRDRRVGIGFTTIICICLKPRMGARSTCP